MGGGGRPGSPAPLTRHLGMGLEAGPAREGRGHRERGGVSGFGPRPSPAAPPRASRRQLAPPSRRRWLPRWAGRSGDPAGVPRWRQRWRLGTRGTVPATEAGPARLVTDGPGRGPANGRPPPLRAPRPGLGRAAAALGDARAGPGLSLLNLGRRRARAPGSQAMALRELKVCLLGVSGGGPAGRAAGGRAGRGPGRAHSPSAPSPSLRAGRRLPDPGPSLQLPPPRAVPPTWPHRPEGFAGGRDLPPRPSLEPRVSSRPAKGEEPSLPLHCIWVKGSS